jgi:hypothetical protein
MSAPRAKIVPLLDVHQLPNVVRREADVFATRTVSLIHIFFPIGATAPIWALAYLHKILRFTSVFFSNLRQSVGLLGRVISSSQGLYLYTNTEKRT